MFAVIETGGKQYKVAKDDIIRIEKIAGKAGDKVDLDRVLLLNDEKSVKIGDPLVSGAKVSAEIVDQTRGDKLVVFKKKRRKKYRRTQGHRQDLTVLKILSVGSGKAAAKKAAAAQPKKADTAKSASKAAKKTSAKSAPKKTAGKAKSTASAGKKAKPATSTKKAKATGAAKTKKSAKAPAKTGAKKKGS